MDFIETSIDKFGEVLDKISQGNNMGVIKSSIEQMQKNPSFIKDANNSLSQVRDSSQNTLKGTNIDEEDDKIVQEELGISFGNSEQPKVNKTEEENELSEEEEEELLTTYELQQQEEEEELDGEEENDDNITLLDLLFPNLNQKNQ